MATINKFEDIEAWQLSRKLADDVYIVTISGTFARDFKLRDQINGSSGSVMDNIAEGFGRGGRNEFLNFLGIASGSLNETKSQLYRAFDRKHISKEQFENLYNLADQTGNKLGRFIQYLNTSAHKGQRFKDRTTN